MKKKMREIRSTQTRLFCWIAILTLLTGAALAAPSLPITKPPVTPNNLTGPMIDPMATNGQWFVDLEGLEEYRTHEFYDNIIDHGGGTHQSLAIEGVVLSINGGNYTPGDLIMAFDIDATIRNDTATSEGVWLAGSNSHGESLTTQSNYVGTLIDTKLTAEFAIIDPATLPMFMFPYRDRQPYIVAENPDQHAWYCWNEEAMEPQSGNYYVPTWDFGDISIGQQANRTMSFAVNPSMDPTDSRYTAIVSSLESGVDIFANRTTSLKISTWIDELSIDAGIPYPEDPLRGSDVSVFHNIEEEEESLLDWGDAPDTGQGTSAGNYETLASDNGAHHYIIPLAPYFDDGTTTDKPDPELDGQPNATATGDDLNTLDDEDGITFGSALIAGQSGSVTITVDDGMGGAGAGRAWVDGWIDFNADGDWTDLGEKIQSGWLPQGPNTVNFTVPASAAIGKTYARFRINSVGVLQPTGGPAVDGEVEDHIVDIEEEEPQEGIDWGDAPDVAGAIPTYNTLLANNGANHQIIPGIMMGATIDAELDGQPTPAADGDDLAGAIPDDEDGVIFNTPLTPGQPAQIDVVVSGAGWLDVWLDADNSGDWTGPNDLISSGPVTPGLNPLLIPLPSGIKGGPNYMRFRYNTGTALSFLGPAQDGEVEDYAVDIESLDFGDAPAGFNTLLANNGANHTILTGVLMGAQIDAELNGQPTPLADGDDIAGVNDEDGVGFTSPIVPGQSSQFTVTVSVPGQLDVWLDVDANGAWGAQDKLWSGAVVSGPNVLNIHIPYRTVSGSGFMRFRYNTGSALPPTGWAADGEVEDYQVVVEDPELDWGDAKLSYPTLASSSGANHIITTGVLLGSLIDSELDGQPTPTALGDDANNLADEDGVTWTGKITAGSNITINVTAGSAGGKLDAWIDFNTNGIWAHPNEHLWNGASQVLSAGSTNLVFVVPQPSALGQTYARFRISTAGGLPPDNASIPTPDGEVEDYMIELYQPAPTNLVITNLAFNTSSTVATVEWIAENDIAYQMQATTNLVISNSWVDVESVVLGPVNSQTNSMVSESNKFYRITAPWTP